MQRHKKIIFSLLLLIFSFSTLTAPRPANAFMVTVAQDVTGALKWAWEKVEKAYDVVQGIVGAELANRTVEMYLNTIAHDIATELATGGPGGKPMFRVTSMQNTLKRAGQSAAGEFLAELTTKGFDDLGINLCNPTLDLRLTLTLSLLDTEAPPKPRCEWRSVVNNWRNFDRRIQDDLLRIQLRGDRSGSMTDFFSDLISGGGEIGDYLKLSAELNRRKLEAQKALELEIQECQGFIDKKTPVSDEVITHCSQVHGLQQSLFTSAVQADVQRELARKEAASNRKLSDILSSAAKRFTNTFTSKLLNYYIRQGSWSYGLSDLFKSDYREDLLAMLRGGADLRQPRGQDVFKSFQTIDFGQVESYDYLTNYSLCPDQFRNPDHCTMSPSFLQAVNGKYTIKEAIERGIINGNITLIGPDDPLNGNKESCYRDFLCYSNLVKLRQANIIPVGWEMAAMRGLSVTLQEAVNCFEEGETCRYSREDKYSVDGVAHNPFYHLIDPDWVLKASQAYCNAMVYSSVLESPQSSNRMQYCADAMFCLQEDNQGNCLDGHYGYCTRSENTWRFQGEECIDGDVYSGCLTFNHSEFGQASYIENTLQYCSPDQAGCRRYSQSQTAQGDWFLADINSDPNDLFLNNQASSCPADQAGCSEFIVMAADTNANLIPNGDFEMDTSGDNIPDGYMLQPGSSTARIVAGEGVNGSNAVLSSFDLNSMRLSSHLILAPYTNYTVSIDVKLREGFLGNGPAWIGMLGCIDINNQTAILNSPDGSMYFDNGSINLSVPASQLNTNSYTRITGNFNSGNSVSCILFFGSNGGNQQPHYFDNLKMEVVSVPKANSNYSAYGAGARIYMNDNRFMCLAEEAGCQGYFPLNGDPMVPAVLTPQDLCPAECVGYATFTEQVNIFDVIEDPLADVRYFNFIPDTARACPFNEVGCEEFTNLEEVAAGGEGREYYTYLRQCVPENLGMVYYTWEGSDVAGYQIKTWNILDSNIDNAPCTNIIPGTNTCIDSAAPENRGLCGPETANPNDDPDVDPNCRQFFDPNGNSYYRFQDRVIFASNDCHEYRRTLTGQIYKAIPSLSNSCAESNNNCRAYYGNTSNNQRVLFSDNFEQNTYEPWQGPDIALSSESLNNEGRSLRILTNENYLRDLSQNEFRNNREYQVSWWMKADVFLENFRIRFYAEDGSGNSLPIWITDGDASFENIASGNWRLYTASFYINDDSLDFDDLTSALLQFRGNSVTDDQNIYLDNIILKETVSSFAFVRNSWQTPAACDSPYTGYHLGCQAYQDTNRNTFNIKSFSSLCREQAIGCLPAIDTRNSTYPFAQTFNSGDNSEITVSDDSIVYLVPNPAHYCPPSLKGCQALGLPTRDDPSLFDTVYKINDPDKYQTILCTADALGCEEYNSSKGSYYFRDPAGDTCTYQQNISIGDNIYSGWFTTESLAGDNPVGCNDDGVSPITPSDLEFRWDYCHVMGQPNNRVNYFTASDCQNNGHTWQVQSRAALCPASKNLCTSFRDPSDPVACDPTINNPNIEGYCTDSSFNNQRACENNGGLWTPRCQDYYYYDNQRIDEASCNGLVDKNEGCVLFYEANNWNADHTQVATFYDASQTYNQVLLENRPMSPITCNPNIDGNCQLNANRLIKVKKDRQCAEWLTCKSSTAVWDEQKNQYQIICDNLDACIEYNSAGGINTSKCSKWDSYDEDVLALTLENYQQRSSGSYDHIQWSDKEYTGYSIPNYLPVKDLQVYNFGDINNPDPRLAYGVYDNIDIDSGRRYFDGCVDNNNINLVDGTACSAEIDSQSFAGQCQNGQCLVNPKVGLTASRDFAVETRGYSIADAPFPAAIEDPDTKQRLTRYGVANICQTGDNGCEEFFVKVTYGREAATLYYPASTTWPNAVCTGGNDALFGTTCTDNTQCNSADRSDGVCSWRSEIVVFRNWEGICLEYDNNITLAKDNANGYYCNQWYPAAKISGTTSLYDNYVQAGYYDASGNDALFCAMAEPYQLTEERIYCSRLVPGLNWCSILVRVPVGARININNLSAYPDILNSNYLNPEVYRWYPHNDTFRVRWPGESERDEIIGFDRIERVGSFNEDTNARFLPMDFVGGMETVTTYQLSVLENIFDTTHLMGTDIEVYFYDEDINYLGSSNASAAIKSPSGFSAIWGPECDLAASPSGWRCGDYYDSPNIYSGHGIRNDTPEGDFHQIFSRPNSGEGAGTSVYDCRGSCGWGQSKVCRAVYCNPLNHNYYVKAQYSGTGPWECLDFNCTSSPDYGMECLLSRQAFGYYYSSYSPPGVNCDPASSDYDECLFVKCVAGTTLNSHNDPNNSIRIGDDYYPENNVTYCSDFGRLAKAYIEVNFTDSEEVCQLATIPTAYGCFQHLFDFTERNIIHHPNLSDCNGQNIVPEDLSKTFWQAERKSNIDIDLFFDVFNDYDQQGNLMDKGCLEYIDTDTENAFCRQFTDVPDSTSIAGGNIFNRIYETYPAYFSGTDCDGANNTDNLNCYQQCRLVTQLDSEADLSWVRTDIWWRSQQTNEVVTVPRWDSFYYSGTSYTLGTDVVYRWPSLENDTHFGAARGSIGEGLVVTRVPLSNEMGQLSAGTFFSVLPFGSGPLQITATWLGETSGRLENLFYRAYNLSWNSTSGQYEFLPSLSVNMDAGNNRNDVAGPDYNPRVLAVCNNELCPQAGGGYIEGFSINNSTSGNLEAFGGSLFVNLKFYYHAHPDHMPITSIDMDWGDGLPGSSSFTLNPGKYKNSLPLCDQNELMPGLQYNQSFGGLSNTCHQGFKVFYHDYQYDLDIIGVGNRCDGIDGKPTADASCFQPTLRIIDRWGWTSTFSYPDWIVVHAE